MESTIVYLYALALEHMDSQNIVYEELEHSGNHDALSISLEFFELDIVYK